MQVRGGTNHSRCASLHRDVESGVRNAGTLLLQPSRRRDLDVESGNVGTDFNWRVCEKKMLR